MTAQAAAGTVRMVRAALLASAWVGGCARLGDQPGHAQSPLTVAVPETVCALVSAALCSECDWAEGYRFNVCSGTVVWPVYSGAGWG